MEYPHACTLEAYPFAISINSNQSTYSIDFKLSFKWNPHLPENIALFASMKVLNKW